MTDGKPQIHWRVALLVAVLLPMPAFAQTEAVQEVSAGSESLAPHHDAYGTIAETLLPVSAYDFEGQDSSTTTGWEASSNRRYRTGGNAALTAGLNLPNGAQITKVAITGCDSDAAAALEGYLIECPEPGSICGVSAFVASTAGTPGCDTFTTILPTPRTVNNSTTNYSLQVSLNAVGPTLRFRRMAVYYKLQVSPAPTTARFTDVPVGHPIHRFVEALAAAGITGGCTANQYCPDAGITRGQMAVFLSVALGMHWPN